jgi:hydroxymethylpyrimidine pyrophosphatase-like HAD family hydrolase
MIKLLALDLDGTLVDAESQLTEANRAAVVRARAAGLEALIVTGRSWRGTRPVYDALGLTCPAICYLGALVVGDATGRILYHRPLAPAAWAVIRELAVAEGLSVTACIGTDQARADGELTGEGVVAADTAYSTCRADDFASWDAWNPYTDMAPDLAPCKAPPIMVAVYGDRAVRRVTEAFPQGLPESQFDLHDKVAGETVLHIWHASIDKGRALAEYCRRRSIRPEEVAAFGDMPMDASMLRFAGLGVAVPGAHPYLKAMADWVAEPWEAIDRILRG